MKRHIRHSIASGSWLWLSGLLGAVAVACSGGSSSGGAAPDSGSEPATPGEAMCLSLQASVSRCGPATSCDSALVADCAQVVDLVSADFSSSSKDCMEAGGAPTTCLSQAVENLAPTSAQKQFATTFCNECAGGLVPACEQLFFTQGDSVPEQLRVAGKLILPFSDSLVAALETECATANPLTCVAGFASCAQGVLAKQAIPTESAQCLLDSLVNGGGASDTSPSTCDAGSGSGGAGGEGGNGGESGSGSSTGGSGNDAGICPSTWVGASCTSLDTGSPACNTCVATSCCTALEACLDDPACAGFFQCIQSCSGAPDVKACTQQVCGHCLTQQAIDLFNPIPDCLDANCATEC